MFSNRIANSAKFLQMPSDAQLLYFHMVLRADDDGVVEAYPLVKLLGSPADVMKVLLAKGYVKQLNEDQVVVLMDWLEHNTIRADRKVDSIYKHLIPSEIKVIEPKPRSDVEDNSKRISGRSTDGISKVRLGKVNLTDFPTENEGGIKSDPPLTYEEVNDEGEPVVRRKGMKRPVTVKPYEFNQERELTRLKSSPAKAHKIVALYYVFKGMKFNNYEQWEPALARHVKIAKTLTGYTSDQLIKTMEYCKNEWGENWTMETVAKWANRPNQ